MDLLTALARRHSVTMIARWLCLAIVLCTSQRVAARWTYHNIAGAAMNAVGVLDVVSLRWEMPLYAHAHPVLAKNFFAVVPGLGISSIYLRPFVRLELAPLSILVLALSYEPEFYYGDSGFFASYRYATANFGTGPFTPAPPTASGGYAALLHQAMASITLQAEYAQFALRNVARVIYVVMRSHGNDSVFYKIDDDILMPTVGAMLRNDTDLVYRFTGGLTLGAHHTLEVTGYPPSAFPPGASTHTDNSPISRVGPLIAYTFTEGGGRWQKPTLLAMVNWYALHPYRTGQLVSRAVPYALVAFSFSGDL